MVADPQEGLWVLQAQAGDRAAIEALLRRLAPALHRYVRGIVGAEESDDVLQEALVLIYRKLAWLRSPELLRPWAFRIASRVAFGYLRKRRRRMTWEEQAPESPVDVPDPALLPDADRWEDFLVNHVVSPACSAILTLHFKEGLSLSEVAAVLEMPIGTVKSRLAYGLGKLRGYFATRRTG